MEEAIRLREKLKDVVKSIKVVTIGPPKAVDTLRTALAMGADSGIHVEVPDSAPPPEPLGIAKALRALIEKQKDGVDLVIMGKQAIDDDAGQTGQMLAGLMNWPQATFASKLVIDPTTKVANVTQEIDGGLQEVKAALPLIVTSDLRYVVTHPAVQTHDPHSLPQIKWYGLYFICTGLKLTLILQSLVTLLCPTS